MRFLTLLIPILLFLGNCISRQIPIPKDRLTPGVFKPKGSGKPISYLIYYPKSYYSDQWTRLPLLLFLHGKGERGQDLKLLSNQGLPKSIQNGEEFPFLLIAPQLPVSEESWYTDELLDLIGHVKDLVRVDEERIYLTGLSMGGNGAWKLAMHSPETFAGVIPISGYGDSSHACALKDTPVWSFHGAKDKLILPERTIEIHERLSLCNPQAKITIYPEAGHDAWTETYSNPDVLNWLVSQRKKKLKN
ncbi:MAG: dienelactone hydrolase family protein [Leptospiraceae bacterium]|nr:dienelactone hydrolase family protein [Leptospiraceae bacterium]